MEGLDKKEEPNTREKNMTYEQLLKHCACGEMPRVRVIKAHKGLSLGAEGVVVTIKNSKGYRGIGVDFGRGWDDWFYAEEGTDKRMKYMNQLEII